MRTTIGSLAAPPAGAHDAYLRLHLLSGRLVRPRGCNLDGVFGVLAGFFVYDFVFIPPYFKLTVGASEKAMFVIPSNVVPAQFKLFELIGGDAPDEVVIDEYVEIAKSFFDGPEPGFVNGALDGIARDERPA